MSLGPASEEMNDLPVDLLGGAPRRPQLTSTGWTYLLAGSFFFMLGVAGAIYIFEKTVKETTAARWWPAIFPLWLAIFGVVLVRRFPLQHRLASEGIVARGSITEREWKGPSRGPYVVDYTFRNASDEVEIGSCPSDPRKVGSVVWVLYLPSNPSRNALYPLEFFRIDR
jgi:hypothetical protein